MRITFYFKLLGLAFIFNCCGIYNDIQVSTEAKTDFSRYKTFAWLEDVKDTSYSPYNNEVIRNNIRNYFGKQFIERGYTLELDTPDVLLQLVIRNKPMTREVIHPVRPPYFYYGKYYFGSDYYYPYPSEYYYRSGRTVYCSPLGICREQVPYVEGSITLNVIDCKEKYIVWSCTAKGDIYDPAFIKQNIHPAVKAIMKQYPVSPVKDLKAKENYPALSGK